MLKQPIDITVPTESKLAKFNESPDGASMTMEGGNSLYQIKEITATIESGR